MVTKPERMRFRELSDCMMSRRIQIIQIIFQTLDEADCTMLHMYVAFTGGLQGNVSS